jgi:hypothetical protein
VITTAIAKTSHDDAFICHKGVDGSTGCDTLRSFSYAAPLLVADSIEEIAATLLALMVALDA